MYAFTSLAQACIAINISKFDPILYDYVMLMKLPLCFGTILQSLQLPILLSLNHMPMHKSALHSQEIALPTSLLCSPCNDNSL